MEVKTLVTVVPIDNLIIVEGKALQFFFEAPPTMHALQWYGQEGHIEWTDDLNHPLTLGDYADDVQPFVEAWEAEKARLEIVAKEQAEAAEALYNSQDERAKRVRAERDTRLNATQWLVERHADEQAGSLPTTLSPEEYAELLMYRQALRDIPTQTGFPWDAGEGVPWPNFSLAE